LASLVSSGSITQAQSAAVKSTFDAARTSGPSTRTDPLDSLVTDGTITQNQENTINSVFAAAMQAYGANRIT
jgi:hypothetical protein